MASVERSWLRARRGVVRARAWAPERGLSAAGVVVLLFTACADFARGEPSPPDTGVVPATVADTSAGDTEGEVSDDGVGEVGPSCAVAAPLWGLGEGLMLPGTDCLECHVTGQVATQHPLTLAGTVFGARTCPSPAPEAVVRVVDASGVTVDLPVNAAGNFYTDRALAVPWTVSLVAGDAVTAMATRTSDGHCNRCHTAAASGYISPPASAASASPENTRAP